MPDASTPDTWGWIAAGIGALAHGSWGAAIKAAPPSPSDGDEHVVVDIHPLVFQSYKTTMLFVTCWLSLIPLETDQPKWTPYGILSGVMFVVGGVGGIVAIQTAGVSVAVGTWASIMVAINFIWGIVVFQEPVHSFWETLGAFSLLATGLVGMSHYSAASTKRRRRRSNLNLQRGVMVDPEPATEALLSTSDESNVISAFSSVELIPNSIQAAPPSAGSAALSVVSTNSVDSSSSDHPSQSSAIGRKTTTERGLKSRRKQLQPSRDDTSNIHIDCVDNEHAPLVQSPSSEEEEERSHHATAQAQEDETTRSDNAIIRLGSKLGLQRRQVGILCAVWNGIFNGSSLLPLHYAKQQGFGGLNYMVSFGCGSLIANGLIWIVMWIYEYAHMMKHDNDGSIETESSRVTRSWRSAWDSLPPIHWAQTWKQGVLAGLILSMGMYGSIIATSVLGQGVGNSLIQCKIFVSGLWGILVFREITEREFIVKWFASAALSVTAIIWLSYERLTATSSVDKD